MLNEGRLEHSDETTDGDHYAKAIAMISIALNDRPVLMIVIDHCHCLHIALCSLPSSAARSLSGSIAPYAPPTLHTTFSVGKRHSPKLNAIQLDVRSTGVILCG